MNISAPRWDLSNVYPSLESEEFRAAIAGFKTQLAELEAFFDDTVDSIDEEAPSQKLGTVMGEMVDRLNTAYTLSVTLEAYIYSHVSTDSRNKTALRAQSEFEILSLPMKSLEIRVKNWLGRIGSLLEEALQYSSAAKEHAFILQEKAAQSKYMMRVSEEKLAAELTLSGGNAWEKLQRRVTSQLSVDFAVDGELKKMSMPEMINLRTHADENVRRRGYEAESVAWEKAREIYAACLNGVKGEMITLNRRRGRKDALEPALEQARIDRQTLDAMFAAVKDSLPMFGTYYRHKAGLLGKERLAWWDIFAPVGRTGESSSFEEARDIILRQFKGFSPKLAAFAEKAFVNNWIDSEMREGKQAGAFCMDVPGVKESRILSNFDGSGDQIATLAHELGHGFHNECAYRQNKTMLQQQTPMTLAETASTFCELIVSEAVLERASDPQEELAVLETQLCGASQVVVDIYSRFLFEQEVYQRREQAELSAEDFCGIMEHAQKTAFGEGLDERYLQKYMWTWKPHYYFTELPFYNFPYTFGLLFGTGLYAVYRKRGDGFVADYSTLLASTGEATAAELAARFDIDIGNRAFWDNSLEIIGRRVKRYCEL